MSKEHVRVGTAGWVASVANEEVLGTLTASFDWSDNQPTKTLEIKTRGGSDLVVKINGYTSVIPVGVELEIVNEYVKTFVTVTEGIEYILTVTY